MKKFYAFLMMAATLAACTREEQPEPQPAQQPETVENTEASGSYTLTVEASKSLDDGTKALGMTGNTLNSTWCVGDSVTVYKGLAPLGRLGATEAGASTTFSGKINGTLEQGDVLTLKFLDPYYDTQDGTLEYIAAHCDYSEASVTVNSIGNGQITTSNATFVNQQAVVKFTLKKMSGNTVETLSAATLIVTDGTNVCTVVPETASDMLYVAIPAVTNGTVTLVAAEGEDIYKFETSSVSLASGKYYSIVARLTKLNVVRNESELRAALASDMTPIVFDAYIQLSRYLDVDHKNVNIDLNGHRLYRSGGSYASDGHVIWAHNGTNLTLTGGYIEGGMANNGGAIHIPYGNTVTASYVTFRNNRAAGHAGAVWNNGTFTASNCDFVNNTVNDVGGLYNAKTDSGCGIANLTGCTFTGNVGTNGAGALANAVGDTRLNINGCTIQDNIAGTNGGGIWNGGKLSLAGVIDITGNERASGVAHNVFLKTGTFITDAGIASGSHIGVSCESTTGIFTASGRTYTASELAIYSADYAGYLQVELADGGYARLAVVSSGDDVYYIERSWDAVAKKVVATTRTLHGGETPEYKILTENSVVLDGAYVEEQTGQMEGGTWVVKGKVTIPAIVFINDNAKIILCDGASLNVISLIINSSPQYLNIYGQINDSGQLNAIKGAGNKAYWYPAIGDMFGFNGTINIHGGTIKAIARAFAAGLGTGSLYSNQRSGSLESINIYGGILDVQGGDESPAIGGGGSTENHYMTINIYGGDITAKGGEESTYYGGGAGIGGGRYCEQGTVNIHGGTVRATGTQYSAGIGPVRAPPTPAPSTSPAAPSMPGVANAPPASAVATDRAHLPSPSPAATWKPTAARTRPASEAVKTEMAERSSFPEDTSMRRATTGAPASAPGKTASVPISASMAESSRPSPAARPQPRTAVPSAVRTM